MKTLLILVGKTTDSHLNQLVEDYVGRLSHYNLNFSVEVIPELKNTKKLSESQQKMLEGESIMKLLQPSDHVVLLDERGKEHTSKDFAAWMTKRMNSSPKRLVFVIGGPYGFSDTIYQRKNEMMSMSKMTFSHQMVRLIFVEQLYRAMTIINHEPYHHQ